MNLTAEYNQWHQRAFDLAPEHPDEESPWYELVLQYLVPVKDRRVLEVACGRGGFAKMLAAKGALMFGADFSSTALQIARGKASENGAGIGCASLAQADAQYLPYKDNSFDIVISCETIEHLQEPAAAIKEMARVSRNGGLLYLTTPNYFNAMGIYSIYARARGKKATPGSDQPIDHVFLFPRVRRMVKGAGWTIVRSDGTVHQFPILPGHNPLSLPALESNRTLRRILSPLAFHYFVMAKKSDVR